MSVLDFLHVTITLTPIAGAWVFWFSRDRGQLAPLRRRTALAGLVALCIAAAGSLGSLVHSIALGGFTYHRELFDLWLRPNLIICLVALALLAFSRGLSRILGVTASLLILFAWVGSAVAM